MAILGSNFDINFSQILVPGSSLYNALRTKLQPEARLAQLEERRSAQRKVFSSNPARTINQGL